MFLLLHRSHRGRLWLLVALLLGLGHAFPYAQDGLSHYWNFESESDGTVPDLAGEADGVLENGASLVPNGKIGKGFSPNGYQGSLDLGEPDISGSRLTIALWINFSGFTIPDARLVSKATSLDRIDQFWTLSTYEGERLRFMLKTSQGVTSLITDNEVLDDDMWIHLAATYDGTSMRLYVNGQQVGSAPQTGPIVTDSYASAAIGNSPRSVKGADAVFDEVQIYARDLSPQEIAALASGSQVRRVRPILERVSSSCKGNIAHFGYDNTGTTPVEIPIGPDNQFIVGGLQGQDLSQPTRLLPGGERNAFAVPLGEGSIVWKLLNGFAQAFGKPVPPCASGFFWREDFQGESGLTQRGFTNVVNWTQSPESQAMRTNGSASLFSPPFSLSRNAGPLFLSASFSFPTEYGTSWSTNNTVRIGLFNKDGKGYELRFMPNTPGNRTSNVDLLLNRVQPGVITELGRARTGTLTPHGSNAVPVTVRIELSKVNEGDELIRVSYDNGDPSSSITYLTEEEDDFTEFEKIRIRYTTGTGTSAFYLLVHELQVSGKGSLLRNLVYVNDDADLGGNGTSWTSALRSIRDALELVAPGGEIRIAEGIYKPSLSGDQAAHFSITKPVTITGGFSNDGVARNPALFPTRISGNIGDVEVFADNASRLLTIDGVRAVVDGVGFRDAYSTNGGSAIAGSDANGVLDVTLRNCVFNGNNLSGAPIIRISATGPATSRVAINQCTFVGNQGSILSIDGDIASIRRTRVENNQFNAGLIEARGGATLNIINTLLARNSGTGQLIKGRGEIIYSTIFENTTNVASLDLAEGSTVRNTIVWNTAPSEIVPRSLVVDYSLVRGGFPGTGNLNVDPGLSFSFTPNPGSPVIDKAVPISSVTVDIDGAARDAKPDIGAFEFSGKSFLAGLLARTEPNYRYADLSDIKVTFPRAAAYFPPDPFGFVKVTSPIPIFNDTAEVLLTENAMVFRGPYWDEIQPFPRANGLNFLPANQGIYLGREAEGSRTFHRGRFTAVAAPWFFSGVFPERQFNSVNVDVWIDEQSFRIIKMRIETTPIRIQGPSLTAKRRPVLSWQPVQGARANAFRYRIDKSAWTPIQTTSWTPTADLIDGTYRFEVEQQNLQGLWIHYGELTFTIQADLPDIQEEAAEFIHEVYDLQIDSYHSQGGILIPQAFTVSLRGAQENLSASARAELLTMVVEPGSTFARDLLQTYPKIEDGMSESAKREALARQTRIKQEWLHDYSARLQTSIAVAQGKAGVTIHTQVTALPADLPAEFFGISAGPANGFPLD